MNCAPPAQIQGFSRCLKNGDFRPNRHIFDIGEIFGNRIPVCEIKKNS